MKIYSPPKKFLINNVLDFLRNVEDIFMLRDHMIKDVFLNLRDIEKIDILGSLLIYKFIEYTATHGCFEKPRIVDGEYIKKELNRYGFWKLIQNYKSTKDEDLKNLNFQDKGSFFVAPMALLRNNKYEKNMLLPKIETYYKGNNDAISNVLTCLGEVMLNFWEHAVNDSQSILVATGNKNKIEIACADTGDGIISSLLPIVGKISKERILRKALDKNITSKINTNHMGCGLWEVNELVTMNKGRLHLYSEGVYLQNDYGKIKTDSCAYWKGTIIYINLPLNNPKTLKDINCDEDFFNIKINYQ